MHPTLSNWTITRSGAAMTIVGRDTAGDTVKLTDVAQVKMTETGHIEARSARGVWHLALAA